MIGIISDIHGNFVALRECIKKLKHRGVTDIYCLGDVVGYIPLEATVLDILEQNNVTYLMGNHEAMACGILPIEGSNAIHKLNTIKNRLSENRLNIISKWVTEIEIEPSVILVHGSPLNKLNDYVYEDNINKLSKCMHKIIFMGHTHRYFKQTINNCTFVNVGSIGLPRDGNGSCCVIYDEGEVERIAVNYNKKLLLDYVEELKEPIHPTVKELILNG